MNQNHKLAISRFLTSCNIDKHKFGKELSWLEVSVLVTFAHVRVWSLLMLRHLVSFTLGIYAGHKDTGPVRSEGCEDLGRVALGMTDVFFCFSKQVEG